MPDPTCFTPSRCHVNLGAIRRNFAKLGAAASLMPVIKSDAYGHGLVPVAKTLASAGATRFAVGQAAEGAALREAGLDQEITLLLGCLTKADWEQAQALKLMPLAGSPGDLEAAAALHKPIQIAIKCDTGMGRLGFAPDAIPTVINFLKMNPNLQPSLLVSHFACSDMPEQIDYTKSQASVFQACYDALKDAFPSIKSSLCNSAATLDHLPNDVSRPGLAIYGGNPFGKNAPSSLEWAMSVESPILATHSLEPGQSLSYGRIFTAPKDMRVAVVACGYATGFSRNLSNRAQMLAHGRRCRQIGRICMSMCMLDITDMPDVKPGDRAWLMGGNPAPGETAVSPWELAEALDTIPYELLCHFGSLNGRIYDEA